MPHPPSHRCSSVIGFNLFPRLQLLLVIKGAVIGVSGAVNGAIKGVVDVIDVIGTVCDVIGMDDVVNGVSGIMDVGGAINADDDAIIDGNNLPVAP